MSRLLAVAMAIAAVAPAQAVSRYSSLQLSCGEITAIVRREGAAIFRYPSPRRTGVTLYDRYVGNGGYCEHPKVAKRASVPTADTGHCPVLQCKEPTYKYD